MKKLALIVGFIGLSYLSHAQPNQQRQGPPSVEERVKRATKELDLTDAQVEQWTAIHKKYEVSMKDRSKAEATQKAMSKELEATLTEEQLKKFEKMKKQGPPKRN